MNLQKKIRLIKPGSLTIDVIQDLLDNSQQIEISETDWKNVQQSRTFIDNINSKQIVYGVNTGFGKLANTKINEEDQIQLQHNLLLSHATGTGEFLTKDIVKLILLLKINSLARGYSGVRKELLELLIKFYNFEILPHIPAKGSVGASGDLAPLSHLSLPLIGEGEVLYQNKMLSAKEALASTASKPIKLNKKEGLALINGTQVSTAIALHYFSKAKNFVWAATIIGAMSLDACKGSLLPFHEKIHEIRGQKGQICIAKWFRKLLYQSNILDSHIHCNEIQDPYSLRCQAQVLGASLDNLLHVEEILTIEANAVTDNPLIFSELNQILSGGNFHAEPIAQASDLMAIALAEIGAIAERRIALLIDSSLNRGLPAFLVKNPGINSGFMIAHVTAAALASANKALAHPHSVDSIPTSANQEDHVSMATSAAYRLKEIVDNVETILAIELMVACQGIDLRSPLKTSMVLTKVLQKVREEIPFLEKDRYLAPDIKKSKIMVSKLKEWVFSDNDFSYLLD